MKKPKLDEPARKIFEDIQKDYKAEYDQTGSIGKRYARQDEIGTPLCITIDYDTLEDESVTIRDRDTMEQERVKLSEVESYILNRFKF